MPGPCFLALCRGETSDLLVGHYKAASGSLLADHISHANDVETSLQGHLDELLLACSGHACDNIYPSHLTRPDADVSAYSSCIKWASAVSAGSGERIMRHRSFGLAGTSCPRSGAWIGPTGPRGSTSCRCAGHVPFRDISFSMMSSETRFPDSSMPPKMGPMRGDPMTALQHIPVTNRLG